MHVLMLCTYCLHEYIHSCCVHGMSTTTHVHVDGCYCPLLQVYIHCTPPLHLLLVHEGVTIHHVL